MKHISSLVILSFLLLGCSDTNDEKATTMRNSDIQTIAHDGVTREYLLYLPDSYDDTSEIPLLFNFHGFGGDISSYVNDADMRSLANSENFILVYPQGTLLSGSPHWNASLPSSANKSTADDIGFITRLIDDISSRYTVDSERIYACGYSNGGFFSYALACYLSDRIAAIGSVSGTQLDTTATCVPSHPTAMIKIHGTSDGVIPYDGSNEYFSNDQVVDYWVNFNHTNTDPIRATVNENGNTIERFQYTEGDSSVSVVHYKITDGGHVWFDDSYTYEGDNTGKLIWDFVSQYDMNGIRN